MLGRRLCAAGAGAHHGARGLCAPLLLAKLQQRQGWRSCAHGALVGMRNESPWSPEPCAQRLQSHRAAANCLPGTAYLVICYVHDTKSNMDGQTETDSVACLSLIDLALQAGLWSRSCWLTVFVQNDVVQLHGCLQQWCKWGMSCMLAVALLLTRAITSAKQTPPDARRMPFVRACLMDAMHLAAIVKV